jgi:two-component system sensor histidine kinase YesM
LLELFFCISLYLKFEKGEDYCKKEAQMKLFKKFADIVNNMKIRKKLLNSYLIVVLLPFIIVGIYFTNSLKGMIMQRDMNEGYVDTTRIQDRLNEVINQIYNDSDQLYFDKQLQDTVLKQYNSILDVMDAYFHYNFNNYILFNDDIDSIRFYENNDTMLENTNFMKITDNIKCTSWYKNAISNNGKAAIEYALDSVTKNKYLCVVRMVKTEDNKFVGVLVINIRNDYLQTIIQDDPFESIITDSSGNIILAKNSNIEGTVLKLDNLPPKDEIVNNNIIQEQYNGQKSLIITNCFSPQNFQDTISIHTILPLNSIYAQADKTSMFGFYIIGLSLILSLTLIYFFTKLLSSRIIMLRKEMHKVIIGDFNLSNCIKGNDEIGELYVDLNIMVDSINKLIHEVYEVNLQKEQLNNRQKQAEFKMLASQINPHFLFNILENIRMKAHCNGQEELATIVKMLAKIMRRNLEVGSTPVSLKSEIDLIRSYLEIQKFRFGERINYEINELCDIEHYKILPLLLQPIVENAFVHGLEGKETKGKINIYITEEKGELIILVEDDGIGIDENKLNYILKLLNDFNQESEKNIGISNVNQRIKLYYGEKYGVQIYSKSNEGTKVFIKLPINGEGIIYD